MPRTIAELDAERKQKREADRLVHREALLKTLTFNSKRKLVFEEPKAGVKKTRAKH